MYNPDLLKLSHLHRQELMDELAHDRAQRVTRRGRREQGAARVQVSQRYEFEGRQHPWSQASLS